MDGDHLTLLNVSSAFSLAKSRLLPTYSSIQVENAMKQWCSDRFVNYRSMSSAESIRQQLSDMIYMHIPSSSTSANLTILDDRYYESIQKCLCSGLFMQVAHLQRNGTYNTIKDRQTVAIHPSSVIDLRPPWIMFEEFVMTSRNYVRTVSVVKLEWLLELAPHYYDLSNFPEGETKREIESGYRRMVGGLKRR